MKLSEPQRRALNLLKADGAFARRGGSIFTGTRYRLNGETRTCFRAITLWRLVDRGLLAVKIEPEGSTYQTGGDDTFRITAAGRMAVSSTDRETQ